MKTKWKHKFTRIYFRNRWRDRYKNGDWTVIGVHRWFCDAFEYSYRFCFFGFEIHLWFKRTLR